MDVIQGVLINCFWLKGDIAQLATCLAELSGELKNQRDKLSFMA